MTPDQASTSGAVSAVAEVAPTGRNRPPVTVLGLGSMGRTLARALLTAGHPTTVWNRTPGRADALVADGAALAPTARDAVAASPLVIVCVLDHDAAHTLLDPLAETLRGRAVVNLTSATPERARESATWADDRGLDYLSGAIMVPTPLIGTDDALVLYSGSRHVFDDHRGSLAAIAADSDYLGGDAGLASLYDLGMLDLFFAGMTGFLHAAALVGADGVDAKTFLPYAERIGTVLQHTMAELAADVDAGSYPGDEDNVEMELAFVEHITEASAARGIATALPDLIQTLLSDTVSRGHGREGFSSVIDSVRQPTRPTP
jgi:3-hydroxyisobutyrate dehydrogenase-like beta-hydroxyacid dehydrogenase